MSLGYQISVGSQEVERASAPSPFPAAAARVRHKWNFEEDEFDRIPALRRWIADAGLTDVEERGFAGEAGKLSPDDTLVNFSTTATMRDVVRDATLVEQTECPTCGLPDPRVVDQPSIALAREPRAGALLTYVADLDAFAMPAAAVDGLRAADLARGLGVGPVEAPGEPHVIVYSDIGVGEPVAPFGTTGEQCPTCGRVYHRTPDDRPYPALPKYAMYLTFERPRGDPQWVRSTIHGQLWPMVAPEVARWMYERDPQITFVKRGWSPDEVDQAFLPEEYR